jgi:hypothetical protein
VASDGDELYVASRVYARLKCFRGAVAVAAL